MSRHKLTFIGTKKSYDVNLTGIPTSISNAPSGIYKSSGAISQPITKVSQATNEIRFEGTTPQGLLAVLANNSQNIIGNPGGDLEFHGSMIGDIAKPALWLAGIEYVASATDYAARIDYTSFDPGDPIKNFIEANPIDLLIYSTTGGFGGLPENERAGMSISPTEIDMVCSKFGISTVTFKITSTTINVAGIPDYADDTAAGVGGLGTGDLYTLTATQALTVKT